MFESTKKTWLFYSFIFLFILHITPIVYINSMYLNQYVADSYIGLVYCIAALTAIGAIVKLRSHLRILGNYKVFKYMLIIEVLALLLLLYTNSLVPAILSFITIFTIHIVSFINLDIFLEKQTLNEKTGSIRGLYLTVTNSAFIVGPFLSSLFLSNNDFKQVYVFVLVLIFPILLLASELFRNFQDDHYDKTNLIKAFRKIRKNQDVYSTIMCDFVLRFFYAWMIVYIPLYLYQYKDFTLSEIALVVSIALIPFVLVQGISGRLADQLYGEKEMMSIGFVTMSIFTIMIPFIESSTLSIWIAVLFMTRVGASMVEIMTETHLFKRIDSGDLNVISVYRTTTPAGYILGAIAGTVLLQIISFNMLFLILGGIILYGLRYSLLITDTK